jgi:HEAT repeat protein
MGEFRAEAPLRERLNDPDFDVREAVAQALQKIARGTPRSP